MKKIIMSFALLLGLFICVGVEVNASSSYYVEDVYIRSYYTVYTIDDDGRFTNPYDFLYFYGDTPQTVSDWIDDGYDAVRIHITIDMREINDGYQYIFVYQNDNDSSTGNELFDSVAIEHGAGYLKTTWDDYTFVSTSINLNDIEDDELVIRYGASGNYSDDWQNRNVWITYQFIDYSN